MTNQDLEAVRGDTEIYDGVAVQADGTTPQDLTGCDMWFTVKSTRSNVLTDADKVTQKTLTDGIVITSALNGEFTVTLDPADFATLDRATSYYYDVQIVDGAGNVWTTQSGMLTVSLDVTRVVA